MGSLRFVGLPDGVRRWTVVWSSGAREAARRRPLDCCGGGRPAGFLSLRLRTERVHNSSHTTRKRVIASALQAASSLRERAAFLRPFVAAIAAYWRTQTRSDSYEPVAAGRTPLRVPQSQCWRGVKLQREALQRGRKRARGHSIDAIDATSASSAPRNRHHLRFSHGRRPKAPWPTSRRDWSRC